MGAGGPGFTPKTQSRKLEREHLESRMNMFLHIVLLFLRVRRQQCGARMFLSNPESENRTNRIFLLFIVIMLTFTCYFNNAK